MTTRPGSEPVLSADLVARTLGKLDLTDAITTDLAGLNRLYAAFSANVPNDNIQKRIWLTGDRTRPMPGSDPVEFFDTWLAHGTGGTCFAANGALYALLDATGFDARRISGSVLMEGIEQGGNHGSVLVRLAGIDYLVDAQLAAFTALPLVPGQSTSTGKGIHDISAVPTGEGFNVQWYPGSNRQRPLIMRPELDTGTVDHAYFVAQYTLSASPHRRRSPFNEALFIARHFADSILVVSRNTKTEVSSDNVATKSEITASERTRILIEELGISEHAVNAIPADEPLGN